MSELLERNGEISAIDAALAAAADGHGSLILIEGEPGAGKSSLLDIAADLASDREMCRLTARGGEHERDFPYAVIRQLFESRLVGRAAHGEELTGAAALAAPVFDVAPGGAGADRMAIRHGLYWLAADLAFARHLPNRAAHLGDEAQRQRAAPADPRAQARPTTRLGVAVTASHGRVRPVLPGTREDTAREYEETDMTTATELGQMGLQGWREKVADGISRPVAERAPLEEDQVRAVIGAAFFVLAVIYVVKTISAATRQARQG